MQPNEKLKKEVERFKPWAEEYLPGERFGEWECNYSDWSQLYKAVLDFVVSQPATGWTTEQMRDVLYAIARDNECEILASIIGEQHPEMLLLLAGAALEYGEAQAKWQLVVELGDPGIPLASAAPLLFRMAEDADEYVRRRALMVLAHLNAPQTEQLALAAWNRPDENQQWARMAALWSLHKIYSPLLESLMTAAEADSLPYLSDYAKRLRRGEIKE